MIASCILHSPPQVCKEGMQHAHVCARVCIHKIVVREIFEFFLLQNTDKGYRYPSWSLPAHSFSITVEGLANFMPK